MKRTIALMMALAQTGSLWAVGSGAYSVQSVGAKALAMGDAMTAVADDPSTVFYNPAGLANLPGTQVSLGVGPTFSQTDYTPEGGSKESTDNDMLVIPNLYATHRLADNLGIGFGVFTAYGLETHWSNTGSLQYLATDSRLRSVEFSAGVGYQPISMLAVGANAVYARVDARLQSQYSYSPFPVPDGVLTIEGDGDAFGYSAGALLNPGGKYRLGMTYRSAFHTTVEGDTKLTNHPLAGTVETGTKTRIILPDSFTIGGAAEMGEKLLMSADLEWVGWSRVKSTDFTFSDGTGESIPRNWESTWNLGIGASYKLTEMLEPRAGYYYYPQVIPEETWEPSIPDAGLNGFGLGLGIHLGATTVDLAYSYYMFNDRTINNDYGINGKFETNATLLGLNVTHRWQ